MKTRHVVSIILGIVLVVGDLVVLLKRHEIAIQIVGERQFSRELVWGGSSFSDAIAGLTAGGVVGLVLGLILLIFGIFLLSEVIQRMEYGKFLFTSFGHAMVSKSELDIKQNKV